MRETCWHGSGHCCVFAFVAALSFGRCWEPGRPAGCSCSQAYQGLDWPFIVAWPQRMGCSLSMQLLCDCRTLAKIVGDKAAPGLVTFTFIGIW